MLGQKASDATVRMVADPDLARQQIDAWAAQWAYAAAIPLRSTDTQTEQHWWVAEEAFVLEETASPGRLAQWLSAKVPSVGYLGYDLKSQLAGLPGNNPAWIAVPPACFFHPQMHLSLSPAGWLTLAPANKADQVFEEIFAQTPKDEPPDCRLTHWLSAADYLADVRQIREHIAAGDIYELNYCMEFAGAGSLRPEQLFRVLMERSPVPFGGWLKCEQVHLVCASPERFLLRKGRRLKSQPIKGTAPRGKTTAADEALAQALRSSEKERAENMMIMDLVRNDLSRIGVPGSVEVTELFGIHRFPHWHQMITTVEAEQRDGVSWSELLEATFPMGSMTGAPKHKAMQLIEQYEHFRRGIYSGSLCLVGADGDFDANVVIRSLIYDASRSLFSFAVGSAITYEADPESEYRECLLKARALADTMGITLPQA